jgi:hypothetical protein
VGVERITIRGYGSWGGVSLLPTRGYGISSPVGGGPYCACFCQVVVPGISTQVNPLSDDSDIQVLGQVISGECEC